MEKIVLSIYIPTYNRYDKLKKQVEYFIKEGIIDKWNVELVISDNHSTDKTKEYLIEVASMYKNINIFRNKQNFGIGYNVSKGPELTRGKFVWVVGDDDIIYEGLACKVLDLLMKYPQLHHIFINHVMFNNRTNMRQLNYTGEKDGYFNDGYNMFSTIVDNSGFGGQLYITGNVYYRQDILECNSIYKKIGEENNGAVTLGHAMYASKGPGYLIREPMIDDDCDVDWIDTVPRLYSREMIAILVKLGNETNKVEYINNLLINHLPTESPEFEFIFVKDYLKGNLDNYAMKWMLKYYPLKIFDDLIYFFKHGGLKRIYRKTRYEIRKKLGKV